MSCLRHRLTLVMSILIMSALGSLHAAAERRVALVVGNSAYVNTTPLANPLNDARDMTEALKATGFEVVEAVDADKLKLDGALRSFTDKLADADVALFFYAGHGLQVGAQNYLVPIDAKLERERDLEFEAVKLDFVLRQMEIDREGKTSIVILDACRDNPLTRNLARSMGTRSAGIGRGLAAAATGLGTFIAYSTQPGNVAADGKGRNSPFTAALAKHVRVKGRNLPATMIEVRKDVVAATAGKQVPWDHSALTGDFYFVAGDAPPAPGTVQQAAAGSTADVAALQARLAKLEAEAKERERSSAPSAAPGAMIAADGIRLAELRARAASVEDLTNELRKRLTEKSMEQGRAINPDEKQRLQRDVSNLMLEWTRRGQDLKKLRDEIAVLEGKAAPAAPVAAAAAPIPPVTPKPKVEKTSPNFQDVDNVALTGEPLRVFKAPNPIACREACEADTSCAGYQHGRKIPVMGQCQLFKSVTARQEDQSWRSGLRKPGTDGAVLPHDVMREPAGLPTAPSWKKLGFDAYDGYAVSGDVIKESRVDSPAGCLNVCKNTAKCIAASVDGSAPGPALRCIALSAYGAAVAKAGSTAIVRATTAPTR